MGQPTELEGQRAVMLPLRFNDGMVSLGPLPLGSCRRRCSELSYSLSAA